MYRGDRAFCSVECRCKQICMDEESGRRDNCSLAAAAAAAGAPAARHRGRVARKGRAAADGFAC
ncbi:putative FCS-Like Zinc finger 15-like [Cocos nucifera]|uniref:Putative FCS-Like Zinc finger 15-like n=1 Tax=Cocos nucifera TaxID=13894 RepID=A0A8K0MTQ8_COCNU|nr:putative FCS-Like Zinc finger 15-like [Cocos nucifera]